MNHNKHSKWNNRGWGRHSRGRSNWADVTNRGSFRGSKKFIGSRGNFGGDRNQGFNTSQKWQKNETPQRETPSKRLSEEDVGITEYISTVAGFSGIIKWRYSDFQVSEINQQGEVAKLTDLTVPHLPIDKMVEEDEELLLSKYNVEILPLETWDRINKLAVCTENTDETVEIDVTEMSKEQRTKIHNAVKKAFGKGIVGSTVNTDSKKTITFQKFRKGVRIDNRVKWLWPADYLYFIVHKENCDTMEAASKIISSLRMNLKPSMINYAGTKDRRAKTSQWMCIRRVDPRVVAKACKHIRQIHVGNFTFAHTPLKLGLLNGNLFRIALRNITAPEEQVNEACEQLKQNGFLNYYGLQRFGTRIDTPTYQIGLKLLQGKYQEAINDILNEHNNHPHPEQATRVHKESRHDRPGVEARLARALADEPNNFVGALDSVPRNVRLLYLHSYQSLVWNRVASERLRRHGLAPAVGDIVLLEKDNVPEELVDEENYESYCETDEQDDKDDSDTRTESKDKPEAEILNKNDKHYIESKVPVKILNEDDINSGKYSIFDIVLPLPGRVVDYPPNVKDYYEELLTKDGLSLDLHNKVKAYSVSGAYRRVVCRPLELSWQLVRYSSAYTDLILSDLDQLEDKRDTGADVDGKYRALLITMTLSSSCYATMVLRELLKIDTSCDHQASLNNYHKQNDPTLTDDAKTETQSADSDIADAQTADNDETGARCKGDVASVVTGEAELANESRQESAGDKRKLSSGDSEEENKKVKI